MRRKDWRPDERLIGPVRQVIDNPVFVCGFMKSGTTLLTELLDGHPELIVLPGDSHMINKIQQQSGDSYEKRIEDWDLFWISRFVNPTGQRPFWILGDSGQPYAQFLEYLEYWLSQLPSESRSPFLAVVLSYYCANPRRPSNSKMWVEKTPGNERKVRAILALFPQAKFIHIVREPKANLASFKKLQSVRGHNWNCAQSAYSLRYSLKCGEANQRTLGEKVYHVLRYEDLIRDGSASMTHLASFLGVAYSNFPLQPTVNGYPAVSNSMFSERRVEGYVSTEPNKQWQQELMEDEVVTISSILHSAVMHLGYDLGIAPHLICRTRILARVILTKLYKKALTGLALFRSQ